MLIALTNGEGKTIGVNINQVVVILPMDDSHIIADKDTPMRMGSEITFGPNDDYAHVWVQESVEKILAQIDARS